MLTTSLLAWLPAEPGHRGPVANVPIATLQALNRRVELIAHRLSDFPDNQMQENAHEPASTPACKSSLLPMAADNGDSNSESPFSSADWPASSPLERPGIELPPDSSIESLQNHGDEISREVRQYGSNSIGRRLSTTPAPLTPTMAIRENPKRNAEALHKSAQSSPSRMSVPADEEIKRFRCKEAGCSKAYVVASGLRYHLEVSKDQSEHGLC